MMEIEDPPLVSVVIPTHNRKDKLIRLIKSILQSNYPKEKLEIIVVDDASTDGTHEVVKMLFPDVKVIRNERELFPAGSRNVGIKNSQGKYVFLIDDDNVVDKDTIKLLVDFVERHPEVGVVAPLMLYYKESDSVWCAGICRNYITSKTTYLYRNVRINEVKERLSS